jgi:hypothetical protein
VIKLKNDQKFDILQMLMIIPPLRRAFQRHFLYLKQNLYEKNYCVLKFLGNNKNVAQGYHVARMNTWKVIGLSHVRIGLPHGLMKCCRVGE